MAVGLAGTGAALVQSRPSARPVPDGDQVQGVVRDETGRPVAGATLRVGDDTAQSGTDGRFTIPAEHPALLKAVAPGHLPRTQAVQPGTAADVLLTTGSDRTVSVRFGGDVMFGRRYYESRDGRPPALTASSGVADHARLLSAIQPLLEDGDLTSVNLETPLGPDPYYDPKKPRPARFHQSKDLAFASSPKAAEALRQSGVDVVGLGNNHVMDLLGPGVVSTLKALDAARLPHFGAGMNDAQAWAPAYVERKGRTVAFIGCTTITGNDQSPPYVAGADRPGAAACSVPKLQAAVRAARTRAQEVVVQVHGGVEYQRAQTADVRALFTAATDAGASAVIGSHPRVVGGVGQRDTSVVAESMGTLLYDQDLWSTIPSYLLRTDLRDGRAMASTTDAITSEGGRPRPAVGAPADAADRIAAGSVPGTARLAGPGTTIGQPEQSVGRDVVLPPGRVQRVAPGWWLTKGARAGQDLLYGAGDFERATVGDDDENLWELGKFAKLRSAAACNSTRGLMLLRGPASTEDVYAAPAHRVQVTAGQPLSLLVDVRQATKGATAEIAWYTGAQGASKQTQTISLPTVNNGSNSCRQVRLDVVVPPGITFAQPYLRLAPPTDNVTAHRLEADNVRLVAWAGSGAAGRLYDTVEATGSAPARFTHDGAVGDESPVVE
nr:CapA family protein [Flexivirga meconopsidis]